MIKKLDIMHRKEVQTLFLEVFSKAPWHDDWQSEEQLSTYMEELMGNSNSLCLGYYHNEHLIGISLGYVFHWWEGTDYFVKELCIDTVYQGRGYGSIFLSEIEAYLKEHAIKALWLMTDRDTPAYDFYEKNGFKELGDNVVFAKGVK